ncbi:Holliday junction branch migration protein RuvA [bacterium]|jgi:holliday junction DNA helicase RuvA|nr:Holliday junction branch migration protein RuvA [bacterium]MBT6831799.1 Holliday junction branch migration protein RuvA [bacterium]MBT6996754.1 Holliday junction branch migration protein RuvA [bacterium]MBT7772202.1 Holliday junction branch migration protein RuvA [bacterium]
MIGFLTGKIASISEKKILVLTSGGVGYNVSPAGSLLASCEKGGEFSAEIFTIVRETEITLYGFGSGDEKQLFEKLIGVSGIGPKTALVMVSTPADQFQKAVAEGDVAFLTKIPGLGKKTAERLIVELRGKLNLESAGTDFSAAKSKSKTEATDALKNLGYDAGTISEILNQAPDDANTEDLVKFFLSSNA